MPEMNDTQSLELADAIEHRMDELGLTPTKLQKQTGLSASVLRFLRKGDRRDYHVDTTRSVCDALGWSRDSIQRLLDGEPPEVVASPSYENHNGDGDDLMVELMAKVDRRAAHAKARGRDMEDTIERFDVLTNTVNVQAMQRSEDLAAINEAIAELALGLAEVVHFVKRREAALSRRPGELD
jgi:hypothetical protein